MRLCFVVNNVRTQRPTYTTLHLAFAASRRGHDVAFVSIDALSQGGQGAAARRHAAAFVRRYPGSVLAARARQYLAD